MKDVTDILREKEAQLERLGKEIKVLKVAARILSGGSAEGGDLNGADDAKSLETARAFTSNNNGKSRFP